MNVWLRGCVWEKDSHFWIIGISSGVEVNLYEKDGLHLNWKGTDILAGRFVRAAQEDLNG